MKILIKIIKSWFIKLKIGKEIERKRSICKVCEFNFLNVEKIELKKKLLKKFLDFYFWIIGKVEEDNLGFCMVCGCSIYFKLLMLNEGEDCVKNKWK